MSAQRLHRRKQVALVVGLALGDSSIETTERYLGVKQDLTDAPCDRLGLRVTA